MGRQPVFLAIAPFRDVWIPAVLPQSRMSAAQSALSSSPRSRLQHTILVVDDCLVTQTLLKGILSHQYRVLVAGSALEALSIMSREDVDLFLVDLTMPDVDGLELCRTIRRLPLCQSAPIVILTSRDRPFDRVQGSIAGATEYLTKPIDAETLQTTLHKHLPDPELGANPSTDS